MSNDEQVGNNSIMTMTPGSAVAGQLQQILTAQRLEKRQAMIDAMNQQNVASQIRDRDQNSETQKFYRQSMKEQRDANIQDRLVTAQDKYTSELPPGTTINPDDPMIPAQFKVTQPSPPALRLGGMPGMSTPTDVDMNPPSSMAAIPPTIYSGKYAQLEAQRKSQMQQNAQKQLDDPEFDTKYSVAKKASIYRLATGSEPSADIIAGRKEPHSQGYIEYQDYLASKPDKPLSFNDYMTMDANRKLPRVPSTAGEHDIDAGPEIDAVTGEPTGNHIFVDTKTHTKYVIPMSVAPKGPQPKIAAGVQSRLTTLRDKAQPTPSTVSSIPFIGKTLDKMPLIGGDTPPDPAALGNFLMEATQAGAALALPKDVNDAYMEAIKNPTAYGHSAEDIVKEFPELSEFGKKKLVWAWRQVFGK